MWPTNPNRSRNGPVSNPARVVAPTSVNGATSSGIAVAPGPLPTTTSTRKSSIATYNISSAGRAVRWISSRKSTSPSANVDSSAARSPARSMAGPLVMRSGAPSSAATIIAIVVLPSPGGPDSRMWSGGRPRRRAPSRMRESCSRTRSCPMNSSRLRGRRAASITRSSLPAYGETISAATSTSSSALMSSSLAQQLQRLPQQRRDVGLRTRIGRDGSERVDDLAVAPAEPEQCAAQLFAPVRAGLPGQAYDAVARGQRGSEPVLQLEQDSLRPLSADPRHEDEGSDIVGSNGGADRVRRVHSENRLREPWPDPCHRLERLEDRALVVAGEAVERECVLAYDEGRRQLGRHADLQGGERARRTDDSDADTTDLDDGGVRSDGGDRAAEACDHRAAIAAAASLACTGDRQI